MRSLNDFRFIPVVTVRTLEDAVPTVSALRDGGLPVAEITFRTACAEDAIRAVRRELPDVCAGAGTVIDAEQCVRALDAGAAFIVSPGLSEDVAHVCRERGVPYVPGCVTPT
ncbi:MAG: 2-dehydro-3-deoxyphosphogluconate aldolase, partial [Clostridia bacterium]|nr:2-dehydro-3-deoxyphosphogluconate aldolase [Clostridia bacterium]